MSGREAERMGSIEVLSPNSKEGMQVNCGVRIRGGFSRTSRNPKHGFRLFFRRQYGPGKLRYPMFGKDAAQEFDNVDLRCSQNYSWNMGGDERGLFVRDQFSRDLQLLVGFWCFQLSPTSPVSLAAFSPTTAKAIKMLKVALSVVDIYIMYLYVIVLHIVCAL